MKNNKSRIAIYTPNDNDSLDEIVLDFTIGATITTEMSTSVN